MLDVAEAAEIVRSLIPKRSSKPPRTTCDGEEGADTAESATHGAIPGAPDKGSSP